MIKDYMSWAAGTIELNDPDIALHTIKHKYFDGNEDEYLSQLAMVEEPLYFTLIARLVHTYGPDHPAIQYIAKMYDENYAQPIKFNVQGNSFYPLDVFIALGITGKALLSATMKTHEAFADLGIEYTYGLHRDLADFTHRGQASKHQVELVIDRFYNHYCVFGNTVANNRKILSRLESLKIDIEKLSSNVSLDNFIDLYKNWPLSSAPENVSAHVTSNVSSNGDLNLRSYLNNNVLGASLALTPVRKPEPPASRTPPESVNNNGNSLEVINKNQILQKGLADQLAKYKCRQQFEIVASTVGGEFNKKPKRRHVIFIGPPGTGKTTLAGNIGQFFHEVGFLSKGHVHKTTATQLTGEYVAKTMGLVRDAVQRALGGVLFIDEVYHWVDDEHGYGNDAVNELLEQMETHRNNLIVAIAGYKGKIETFLNMNDGLAERFSTRFHFEHFSREELSQILDLNLNGMNLKITDVARRLFIDYLESRKQEEGDRFANARTLENLLEETIDERAVRWESKMPKIITSLGDSFGQDLLLLNEDDVRSAIRAKRKDRLEPRRTMGFGGAHPD